MNKQFQAEEDAERFAYGWDGRMDPDEYKRLWQADIAARVAFCGLPWYKRLWEQVRGRKPRPWEGV